MKLKRVKKQLTEILHLENVESLASINGYDIYSAQTYAGAQEFFAGDTPAGKKYVQNESTFAQNIGPEHSRELILFTPTDSRNTVAAAINGSNDSCNFTIYDQDEQSSIKIDAKHVALESTTGNFSVSEDLLHLPLFAIPNAEFPGVTWIDGAARFGVIIQNNVLTAVPGCFTSADNVELDLRGLNITEISPNAFNYGVHIQNLIVDPRETKKIPAEVFSSSNGQVVTTISIFGVDNEIPTDWRSWYPGTHDVEIRIGMAAGMSAEEFEERSTVKTANDIRAEKAQHDLATTASALRWQKVPGGCKITGQKRQIIIELPLMLIPENLGGYPVVEIGPGAIYNVKTSDERGMQLIALPPSLKKCAGEAFSNYLMDDPSFDIAVWLSNICEINRKADFDYRALPLENIKLLYESWLSADLPAQVTDASFGFGSAFDRYLAAINQGRADKVYTAPQELTEAKGEEEYIKNYSKIPEDIFREIVAADPKSNITNNEISSIGFGSKQLTLPKYLAGETEFVDNLAELTAAFNTFYSDISHFPRLNAFTSVKEFIEKMKDPEATKAEVTTLQKEVDDPLKRIHDKYYPSIDLEIFNNIIAADPKSTSTKIGEVARNLFLRQYLRGETSFIDDLENLKDACQEFYDNNSSYPANYRDLNIYKSVADFITFINQGEASALRQRLESDTTPDPDRNGSPVSDSIRFVAATPNHEVYEPLTLSANKQIAAGGWDDPNGMRWCTSSAKNPSFWIRYTRDNARLFDFMDKTRNSGSENRKYNWQLQLIPEDGEWQVGEFRDGNDEVPFEGNTHAERFKKFLLSFPEVCKAIANKDPFDKVPEVAEAFNIIKNTSSKKLVIDDLVSQLQLRNLESIEAVKEIKFDIPEIPVAICAGCTGLRQVEFTSKVKKIGAQAFKASGIKTVSLPEGLEIIDSEAFAQCPLRGSIRLPDSLKEVRFHAFSDTHCQLKINQNRTTKIKFSAADAAWLATHVKLIKE